METEFTRLVGCQVPIQQAGMGAVAGPDLAAAVTNAGAVGMLGAAGLPIVALDAALSEMQQAAKGPFGVNFLMPFLDRDAVRMASERAHLVEFFYGEPDPGLVAAVHSGGALAAWQVGSVEEARLADRAGTDLIVVQGTEAGGHVRGTVGLLPLLDRVLDETPKPVVAAGGLGSARSVAAVLACGAAAARVGTRFLAAAEADVHPDYLDALLAARPEDTEITTAFGAGWPEAPHRVLRRSLEQAAAVEGEMVGTVELPDGTRLPVPRWSPVPPGRSFEGRALAAALYAGQSVGCVTGRATAAEIVAELAGGVSR